MLDAVAELASMTFGGMSFFCDVGFSLFFLVCFSFLTAGLCPLDLLLDNALTASYPMFMFDDCYTGRKADDNDG